MKFLDNRGRDCPRTPGRTRSLNPEPVRGTDYARMMHALRTASGAAEAGEVPVGAAIYGPDGRLLAASSNRTVSACDPSAHAEILCLRLAARKLGNHRLDGCEMHVTIEPCAMCAGAIVHARLSRLVYGADEPKGGACGSVFDVLGTGQGGRRIMVTSGVLAKECGTLVSDFFSARR